MAGQARVIVRNGVRTARARGELHTARTYTRSLSIKSAHTLAHAIAVECWDSMQHTYPPSAALVLPDEKVGKLLLGCSECVECSGEVGHGDLSRKQLVSHKVPVVVARARRVIVARPLSCERHALA
jgi:hypothetical protein